MKHRTAFIIASALTAFVLIFVGGITAVVTPKVAAFELSPTANPTDTSTDAPTSTQTSSPTATTGSKVKTTAPQVSVLTADQALKIALRLAPNGKLQKQPGLVNYKGRMAYEVLLDVGTLYIDAFTGKVLYDGTDLTSTPTLVPPTPDPTAGSGGGGGGGGGRGGKRGNGPSNNPAPPPPPAGGGGGGGGGGGHGGGGGDDSGGHGGGDH